MTPVSRTTSRSLATLYSLRRRCTASAALAAAVQHQLVSALASLRLRRSLHLLAAQRGLFCSSGCARAGSVPHGPCTRSSSLGGLFRFLHDQLGVSGAFEDVPSRRAGRPRAAAHPGGDEANVFATPRSGSFMAGPRSAAWARLIRCCGTRAWRAASFGKPFPQRRASFGRPRRAGARRRRPARIRVRSACPGITAAGAGRGEVVKREAVATRRDRRSRPRACRRP